MEMSLNQPCWLQETVTWLDQPLQLRLRGYMFFPTVIFGQNFIVGVFALHFLSAFDS